MKLRCLATLACILPTPAASGSLKSLAVAHVGEVPALSTPQSRSVGDVIYETFNYSTHDAVRLSEPLDIDVLAAEVHLAQGTVLGAYKDGKLTAYCTFDEVLELTGASWSSIVCLADTNRDGKLDNWKAPEGPPIRKGWKPIPKKQTFGFSSEETTALLDKGFRYELLYQGVSGSTLSLLYREYTDNLARPAFQQDLTYTLSTDGPTELSFRSIRLRVHLATNNEIRYELLAGLNTAR